MEKEIANDCLVMVNISPGMFSSEYTIRLRLAGGETVSFFADKSLVVQKGDENFLKATLVDKNESKKTILVLLPVEPFEGSRWAEVSKEMAA